MRFYDPNQQSRCDAYAREQRARRRAPWLLLLGLPIGLLLVVVAVLKLTPWVCYWIERL